MLKENTISAQRPFGIFLSSCDYKVVNRDAEASKTTSFRFELLRTTEGIIVAAEGIGIVLLAEATTKKMLILFY